MLDQARTAQPRPFSLLIQLMLKRLLMSQLDDHSVLWTTMRVCLRIVNSGDDEWDNQGDHDHSHTTFKGLAH